MLVVNNVLSFLVYGLLNCGVKCYLIDICILSYGVKNNKVIW